jgi:hypothetical protein
VLPRLEGDGAGFFVAGNSFEFNYKYSRVEDNHSWGAFELLFIFFGLLFLSRSPTSPETKL